MGALPFYRKRELSPRQRACVSLGLPIGAKPKTHLASQLHQVGLGDKAIEYLQGSADAQARRIVELYRSLKSATERKAVTIDYLIMAAGADMHHVWGLIQEEVSRTQCMLVGNMVFMAAPKVADVLIRDALKPGGVKAQQLLYDLARRFGLFDPSKKREPTYAGSSALKPIGRAFGQMGGATAQAGAGPKREEAER